MTKVKCLALLALAGAGVSAALFLEDGKVFAPASWGALAICIWLAYVVSRGWHELALSDRRQLLWGVLSSVAFLNYLQLEPGFEGWGDVYYFCGRQMQFCTCDLHWNFYGWLQALVLWNFVLSSALGAQRLAIQVGLNGLLPGEEVVVKESFVSICWRLLPYWLNAWEQQWGAECSSMMFELPHFAIELLVILPSIQILCSRMKILALPNVNFQVPPEPDVGAEATAAIALNGMLNTQNAGMAVAVAAPRNECLDASENAGLNAAAPTAIAPAACNDLVRTTDNALETAILEHQDRLVPGTLQQDNLLERAAAAEDNVAVDHVDAGVNHNLHWHPADNEQAVLGTAEGVHVAAAEAGLAWDQSAPNILKGYWEQQPNQRWFLNRLRNNLQVSLFTVAVMSLTAFNALYIPLYLESQVVQHPFTSSVLFSAGTGVERFLRQHGSVAEALVSLSNTTGMAYFNNLDGPHIEDAIAASGDNYIRHLDILMTAAVSHGHASDGLMPAGVEAVQLPDSGVATESFRAGSTVIFTVMSPTAQVAAQILSAGQAMRQRYLSPGRGCRIPGLREVPLRANVKKHADEISRMLDSHHQALIPLVEAALAIMRLSCEKLFVLISVFVSYLIFRVPPPAARTLIHLNSHLSTLFQKVILYSFPAVCWIYGAGFIFSTFVSIVFWGAPLLHFYESTRSAISMVRIKSLRPATPTEIERMGGNCAICWGEMTVTDAATFQQASDGSSKLAHHEPLDSVLGVASVGAAALAPSWTKHINSAAQLHPNVTRPTSAHGEPAALAAVSVSYALATASSSPLMVASSIPQPLPSASQVSVLSEALAGAPCLLSRPPSAKTAAGAHVMAVPTVPATSTAALSCYQGAGIPQQALASLVPPAESSFSAPLAVPAISAFALNSQRPLLASQDADPMRLGIHASCSAEHVASASDGNLTSGNIQQQVVLEAEEQSAAVAAAANVLPVLGPCSQQAISTSGMGTDSVPKASGTPPSQGYALPCGHAYHYACLTQWLHQCHMQNSAPTCPMCQAPIAREVHWRFPYPWMPPSAAGGAGTAAAPDSGGDEEEEGTAAELHGHGGIGALLGLDVDDTLGHGAGGHHHNHLLPLHLGAEGADRWWLVPPAPAVQHPVLPLPLQHRWVQLDAVQEPLLPFPADGVRLLAGNEPGRGDIGTHGQRHVNELRIHQTGVGQQQEVSATMQHTHFKQSQEQQAGHILGRGLEITTPDVALQCKVTLHRDVLQEGTYDSVGNDISTTISMVPFEPGQELSVGPGAHSVHNFMPLASAVATHGGGSNEHPTAQTAKLAYDYSPRIAMAGALGADPPGNNVGRGDNSATGAAAQPPRRLFGLFRRRQ